MLGLALSCMTFLSPSGPAKICLQMSGSSAAFEAIAGKLAPIGSEPYRCASPSDLAKRLGVELCAAK